MEDIGLVVLEQPNIIFVVFPRLVIVSKILDIDWHIMHILDQTTTTLHIIVDVTQVQDVSQYDVFELMETGVPQQLETHPNLGWIIYYDRSNPLYNFFAEFAAEPVAAKLRFMNTKAEALEFLAELSE